MKVICEVRSPEVFILPICHFKTKPNKTKTQKCFKYWKEFHIELYIIFWSVHLPPIVLFTWTEIMTKHFQATEVFKSKLTLDIIMIGDGTVFLLWSISRNNEEQEPKQKSNGGVRNVTRVTVQRHITTFIRNYFNFCMNQVKEIKWVAHWGKREDQPGMNPGDLVNHNRTISRNTTPVKISWELTGTSESVRE